MDVGRQQVTKDLCLSHYEAGVRGVIRQPQLNAPSPPSLRWLSASSSHLGFYWRIRDCASTGLVGGLINPLSTDAAGEDEKGEQKPNWLPLTIQSIYPSATFRGRREEERVGVRLNWKSHMQRAVKVYSRVPNWEAFGMVPAPVQQPPSGNTRWLT